MPEIKKQLIMAYNRQAATREAAERQEWKLQEREMFLHAVRERELKTLLELGAGPGHDAKFFQDHGLDVTAIDLAPNMVSLCREKGLRAEVMDMTDLTFPDESFDAVWALNCLLHVPKAVMPNVVEGIKSVLKPGGLFYMGVYGGKNSEGVWEDDDYEPKRFFSLYPRDKLLDLVSAVFTLVDSRSIAHSAELGFFSVISMKT